MIGHMDRCNNCGQALMEIDNRGERLMGCLTCNLWAPARESEGQGFLKKTSGRFITCGMAEGQETSH